MQADGAKVWRVEWMGEPLLAMIENCRLANMAGDMRRTVYVTGDADTFFSIPAVTRVMGKRVTGYVANDDGNLVFRHTYY